MILGSFKATLKQLFYTAAKLPVSVVLKCYDWAIKQIEGIYCAISGFHSQLEKDVLHYLLKCKQPIILAMPRELKVKPEPELEKPLQDGIPLIIYLSIKP
jgi:hypothetical protein